MAKFSIIDATTGAVKYSGTPKYTGSYCKVSVLEFTEISSPTPIDWKVGDYVVYNGTGRTGLTYRLYDIPQPKKQAKNALYGGAFVYSNVQFFPDTKLLEIEPFRDLVPADNNIHFTTQASWSVWTNAANLIDRFNAVMNTAYPNKWEFRLVNATAGTPLHKLLHDTWFDFTISGENVLQGLTKLYDLCGNIGWVHSVENGKNIITVGIPPVYTAGIGTVTELYKYGIGNGLKDIRKSTTNREELKTRLFAYGSTRNMIARYYNDLTPAIKDNDSVYIPNLMLPLSEWGTTDGKKDASKAYIENNVALYGLRPDTVYFDGSNGNKEIYPSLEETTIGELKLAMQSTDPYYPIAGKHADTVRLDEIEAVSGITDDGQKSTAGEKYQYSETKNTQAFSEQRGAGGSQYFDETLVTFNASYNGDLSLDFSAVAPTITDTSSVITLITLCLRVIVGTKKQDYNLTWQKSGSVYTLSIPNVSISCKSGDSVSIRIIGTIDSTPTQGATFAIVSTASTLTAEYATKGALSNTTFTITIPQIGFDISKRARLGTEGLATISMKDGKCGGRSFVVKSCSYNSVLDSWVLTLYRGLDESLDTLFPNTTYPIAVGDHFVLLDIAMPETYIGMAEQKLLAEATALLADISVPKPFYEPSIDAKYMVDNNRTLMEGRYMQLQDTDIVDGTEYVLIDTLVINEGESNIPTYKVTLREQKRVEYSNSQSSSVNTLTSLASGASVQTTVAPVLVNDYFEYNAETHTLIVKKDGDEPVHFGSYGEVFAGGVGSGGSGGGGLASLWALTGDSDVRLYDTETMVAKFGIKVNGNFVTPSNGIFNISTSEGTVTQVKVGTTPYNPVSGVVSLPAYPTTLPASDVYAWAKAATKPSYSYSEISETPDLSDMATKTWVGGNYLAATLKGASNGLAELGSDGKVPSSQLPSYVDDVLEFSSKSAFPATGESGKIYVALDTNLTYRWSGTAYVEISPSLALGETESTAYRGDRGKIAYDHSQESGNPHNTTLAQIVGNADLAAKIIAMTSWFGKNENGVYVEKENGQAVNFFSYGEVTAGGVGSGGSGGSGALYTCADVTAYNNSKVGRSTTEGAQVGDLLAYDGTHWHAVVAPATGVTKLINRTGEITQAQLRSDLGLGNLAYLNGLSKSDVGLGNVDNTADANKLVYGILTSNTSQGGASCYDASPGLHFYRYNGDDNTIGGQDGWILQWSWNRGSVGGQLYLDDNPSKTIGIRGRDINGTFTSWSKIALTSDIPTTLSQLSDDTTHRLVTDPQITAWNNKWDYNADTIKAVKVNNAGTADLATESGDSSMKVCPIYNNEVNFGGTDTSNVIFFGYRATDSKPIPTSFVFGGSTGTASLTAKSFIKSGGTSSQFLKADGSVDSTTYYHSGNLTAATLGLGNVENTALSTWAGSTNINTLGTIAAGVWHGTAITDNYIASASAWNNKWDYNENTIKAVKVNNAGNADNADTVDSLHASSFAQWKDYSSPDVMYGFGWGRLAKGSGSPSGAQYGVFLTMPYLNNGTPGFGWQIFGANGDDSTNPDDIFVRTSMQTTWRSWHKLYHSGNCNNASTPWEAASLTLHGAISGATNITASNLVSSQSVRSSRICIECNADGTPTGRGNEINNFSGPLLLQYATAQNITLCTGGGNVGIGTISPSEKLHVAGNVYSTGNYLGNGEVTAGSDARWKHDIRPVLNGIDAIMRLHPSEWEWNSDNHKGSGLVAQQTREVLPHLVKEDSEGYLHLTYDGLHAYEISAIQTHQTEIEALKIRVAQLENENKMLKTRLA